jgi:acyl-CoA thioesterase YciA
MTFHHPVFVGDEVSIYARILKVGRTSIRIHVEVWRRERESETTRKVTEGIFTFVAIGPDRRPRVVPAM